MAAEMCFEVRGLIVNLLTVIVGALLHVRYKDNL